jgi:CRP-like cAMP-binding protein
MFEVFRNYIRDRANLTDKELDAIKVASTLKKLRKRQYLLQEGDVWQYNAFVCKGCTRMYRVGQDGAEHIMRFAVETWWVGDRESYTTVQPSKNNIDALEDSEILMWAKEDYQTLLREIPELNAFSERLITRSLIASQDRIFTTISSTAEEKYQNFLKTYPDIFNRVPLHMIASYLGVSRETLSRIRSQFTYK